MPIVRPPWAGTKRARSPAPSYRLSRYGSRVGKALRWKAVIRPKRSRSRPPIVAEIGSVVLERASNVIVLPFAMTFGRPSRIIA